MYMNRNDLDRGMRLGADILDYKDVYLNFLFTFSADFKVY